MALSNEDSVDLPVAIAPPNGVPAHREFEDTGEIETAVAAAVASEEDTMSALAKLIINSRPSNGGGGGGDAGAKVLKDIKKHKWLAGLMAMILGPGGMTATYYAIKDRGIANEASVRKLTEVQDEVHPKIDSNTKNIRLIKVDVSNIDTSVDQMRVQQTAIVEGIESLKKENVSRLQKENDRLERALARARGR